MSEPDDRSLIRAWNVGEAGSGMGIRGDQVQDHGGDDVLAEEENRGEAGLVRVESATAGGR